MLSFSVVFLELYIRSDKWQANFTETDMIFEMGIVPDTHYL
jgi:hypothetical protein